MPGMSDIVRDSVVDFSRMQKKTEDKEVIDEISVIRKEVERKLYQ